MLRYLFFIIYSLFHYLFSVLFFVFFFFAVFLSFYFCGCQFVFVNSNIYFLLTLTDGPVITYYRVKPAP